MLYVKRYKRFVIFYEHNGNPGFFTIYNGLGESWVFPKNNQKATLRDALRYVDKLAKRTRANIVPSLFEDTWSFRTNRRRVTYSPW